MKNTAKNSGSHLLEMQDYTLPNSEKLDFPTIYAPLPRNRGNVNFDIYDYNYLFTDEGTKKIIREGRTIGCFYIESPGMRSLLRRLSCDTFEMLTAASSVIRPGVAESGMMQEFIARHKNPRTSQRRLLRRARAFPRREYPARKLPSAGNS